jgi:NAD(P)-dependent dehydrogenase (short-subunit alcohol dehydrogenase family)
MSNVVITAGGGGLGRVIAETFLKEGHNVHICDIDENHVSQTLKDNPEIHGTVTDVGDREQLQSMFAEAKAWMGHIDVLINNVGVAGPRAPVEEMPVDEWQKVIDTNLNSSFWGMKEVLPGMKERKSGVIINITTASAKTFPANRSIYNMTKYALEGLTLSVAKEVGPFNIRCNAVRPGMMNNERMHGILKRVAADLGMTEEEILKQELKYCSMRTMIEMKEVADMVYFLASDAAPHITGQVIAVDGNAEYET